MKIFLKLILSIFILLNITHVFAAGIYCLDNNTGVWVSSLDHTVMDRQVNVGGRVSPSGGIGNSNDRFFALSPVFLQCRNSAEDNAEYQLRLSNVARYNASYSPGFINPDNNVIAYAWNNNTSYSPAESEAAKVKLPGRNSLETLMLQPTIVIYARTTSNIVPAGTIIGTLQFIVRRAGANINNEYFTIRLTTTNDIVFRPETCVINNNEPLDVDLGSMSIRDISATGGLSSRVSRNLTLNYSCDPNITSQMNVRLVGQPSPFSTTAVETRVGNIPGVGASIEHLGIEFYNSTNVLAPNSLSGYTTNITNGIGSDVLTIAPVKSTIANDINLPDGYFNATATLVFLVP